MKGRPFFTSLASRTVVGAAILALVVIALLALLIAISGHPPGPALEALWSGSVGSRYALLSATLVRATPLILTGLAVALAFTAGVLNIGAEGQFLAGAAAATAFAAGFGASLGSAALPAALAAGAVAGAAWALVPATLRRRFGVPEVIATIMMNFVALYGVGYLVRGPLQEPLHIYPQSAPIPESAHMPLLLSGARLHWGFPIAVVCAAVLWYVLRHTAIGFRIRASGASPTAARSAGLIDIDASAFRAFLVSGALAGLGGAVEVTAVTYALYENLSPGYGYTAIAVALLATLDPRWVVASGIFFGALEAGASAMQRDAGVPSVLVSVVEALLILALIAGAWVRARLGRRPPRSARLLAASPANTDAGSRA